jgi:hypothetical protein
LGVAQAAYAYWTTVERFFCFSCRRGFAAFCFAFWRSHSSGLVPFSFAHGVGHPAAVGDPVEALAPVRSADAMCPQYCRPEGVAFSLQVCRNQVHPAAGNRSLNLLPKNNVRLALADEIEPGGPEVAVVLDGLCGRS